jgi:uncharacterized protein YecE (DUF72 family)
MRTDRVVRRGAARVGTSGWQYDDWRGVVYPDDLPRTRWFEHYRSLFDTVEVNGTFYRLPTEDTVDRWRLAAPPGFLYAVKVGAYGTHRRKLREPRTWLAHHVELVRRLGPHLGPNLVQLPPRWHRDIGRLDEFLAAAPDDLRWAVELRDDTWVHDDVFDTLRRHGAALCLHDLLPDQPWELTADWTYLRFHGPDATTRPYVGRYTGRRLRSVAARLRRWLDDGIDVHAYFNNDVGGDAVTDARWLADRLRPPEDVPGADRH